MKPDFSKSVVSMHSRKERLAAILPKVYAGLRERRGYSQTPARRDDEKKWLKAAETLLRHEIYAYEEYLDFQITRAGRAFNPRVAVLFGPEAILAWQEYVGSERLAGDLEQALNYQQREFRHRVAEVLDMSCGEFTESQARRNVLCDETYAISALYRYCFAYAYGYRRIIEQFAAAALQQYRPFRKQYDATWGELIPQPLRVFTSDQLKGV